MGTLVTDNSTLLYTSVCSLKLAGYPSRFSVCWARSSKAIRLRTLSSPAAECKPVNHTTADSKVGPMHTGQSGLLALTLKASLLIDGQIQRAVVLSLWLLIRITRESFQSPNIQTTQSESPGWDPGVSIVMQTTHW